VIPDPRVSTPEDIAYPDEMLSLVHFALAGAQRSDREAFLLHTVEGFSMEEIAIITDRNIAAVRTSIGTARDHLRHSVPLASRFQSRFVPASK
jgi:DNA-directed RNA polymerase specialized sigma24 family protein